MGGHVCSTCGGRPARLLNTNLFVSRSFSRYKKPTSLTRKTKSLVRMPIALVVVQLGHGGIDIGGLARKRKRRRSCKSSHCNLSKGRNGARCTQEWTDSLSVVPRIIKNPSFNRFQIGADEVDAIDVFETPRADFLLGAFLQRLQIRHTWCG